jgi:hypothetical protein
MHCSLVVCTRSIYEYYEHFTSILRITSILRSILYCIFIYMHWNKEEPDTKQADGTHDDLYDDLAIPSIHPETASIHATPGEMGEVIPHWMFTEYSLNVHWMFTTYSHSCEGTSPSAAQRGAFCHRPPTLGSSSSSLNVHWMFTTYSLNVHWMFRPHHRNLWYQPSTSERMFTECSLNVLWTFTERSLNVHWMFTECSLNVYWMFAECSLNVRWMFTECSLNVRWMFAKCSLNVHWMFPECSPSSSGAG